MRGWPPTTATDPDHAVCLALLEDDDGPLVTTAMVIAEAAYRLHRQLGPDAEAALYFFAGTTRPVSADVRRRLPVVVLVCSGPTPLTQHRSVEESGSG